jgi:hypothetical protein
VDWILVVKDPTGPLPRSHDPAARPYTGREVRLETQKEHDEPQ